MERNKLKIDLHVLHAKEIYPAYVLKHNSKHEKWILPSMIPNGEG